MYSEQPTGAMLVLMCQHCSTRCTSQWRFGFAKKRLCNSCWAAEKRGGRKYTTRRILSLHNPSVRSKRKAMTPNPQRKRNVKHTPPKQQQQRQRHERSPVGLNGPAIQSVRSPIWIVEVASAFANKFWGRTEMFDPFPFDHDPAIFDCLTNREWYQEGLKYKTFAYCNPPYAQLKLFIARMVHMWEVEGIPSVALIPHRLHRRYLSIHYGTFPILPVNGGIRFLDSAFRSYPQSLPEGLCLLMIGPLASPMFGLVYRPCDTDKFDKIDNGIEWKP